MTDVAKRLLTAPMDKSEVQVESIEHTALAFEKIYGISG
jgi:hypothetical protein